MAPSLDEVSAEVIYVRRGSNGYTVTCVASGFMDPDGDLVFATARIFQDGAPMPGIVIGPKLVEGTDSSFGYGGLPGGHTYSCGVTPRDSRLVGQAVLSEPVDAPLVQ